MLTLDHVTVHYPGARAPAVANANLAVARGQIVGLLGPSGCGKSSLLRAVAGLEPYQGVIAWDGQDLAGIPVHERGFGLMFQEGQLFPHRTVGGNVAFGLQMAGMPKKERRERVAELLDLVGLTGYAGRRVPTLSGGEQQRVALARSLAPRPKLLLLDEPLSALDRNLREHLAGEVSQILRATGTTALYVTHDQDEAFTVADQVALMRGGHLVQIGTPAEVWAAPVDPEAAAFLGYRLVDNGRLALGPRALHITNATPAANASDAAKAAKAANATNAANASDASDASNAAHACDAQETRSGTVRSLAVIRGEMIADVDVANWGVHPAISTRPVVPGEQVQVRIQPDQVARFDEERTAPSPPRITMPS